MDQSGCAASFPESEIRRFLDEKTYQALAKLRTEKDLLEVPLIMFESAHLGEFGGNGILSILRFWSDHGGSNR
jgi:hypothetical protein